MTPLKDRADGVALSTTTTNTSKSYGAVEGEQYTVAIPPGFESDDWTGYECTCGSTVASSEVDYCRYDLSPQVSMRNSDVGDNGELWDAVFGFLGFRSNPLANNNGDRTNAARNSSAADMRLSMLSNFSTAYNVVSISLSLNLMGCLYPMKPSDESFCSSALIAGMIVGQLAGGALGDVMGRHRAMTAVMLLQVTASICSAMACYISLPFFMFDVSIFEVLGVCRFILGLGCGGVYPLAATLTAESSQSKEDRAKAVAFTFAFQGVGYLAVPVLAWIIISILPTKSDFTWRLILGFGAVPGIVLTFLRVRSVEELKTRLNEMADETSPLNIPDIEKQQETQVRVRAVPVSVLDAILMEEDLVRKMLGTGGCWLLFDILFYGNTLFQPVVLSAAFGSSETVQKAALDTALISLMALPGYIFSVYAVGRQSPQFIQIQGFFAMGVLYSLIGLCFDDLSRDRLALLFLYGSTFFFSNYGPNATTFMLPSMTFSKPCRATLNGICAACGKVGALIGASVFVAAAHRYGEEVVFLVCGCVSVVGCALTYACVSESAGADDIDEEKDPNQVIAEQGKKLVEEQMPQPPMKLVISGPSLIDYV